MSNAERLAHWISFNAPTRPDLLTHLKLQKLAFYCFGACLAFDLGDEVGTDITFEAWEHGPVCRPLWKAYRQYGAEPLPRPTSKPRPYTAAAEKVLHDTLDVYGLLSAWLLRQESHLERPWKVQSVTHGTLPNDDVREHFVAKFRKGPVRLPAYLVNAPSSALDGIPAQDYGSLDRLAQVARSLRS